jgi:predicted nucleic acid-binding protein
LKTLFDTSVLIASLVEPHPFHRRAQPWLDRALMGEFEWVVSAHSLAESYAVLTTLPLAPRIAPDTASRLIDDNIAGHGKIVSLTRADYRAAIRSVAEKGLSGGSIYDALHVRAGIKARIRRLLTFNADDFRRIWPEGDEFIVVP